MEKIATRDKYGKPRIKKVGREELEGMNVWMRKA